MDVICSNVASHTRCHACNMSDDCLSCRWCPRRSGFEHLLNSRHVCPRQFSTLSTACHAKVLTRTRQRCITTRLSIVFIA